MSDAELFKAIKQYEELGKMVKCENCIYYKIRCVGFCERHETFIYPNGYCSFGKEKSEDK